ISLLSPSPGNLGWRVPVRGGVDNRSEAGNHIDSQDVNATAIAIAINDSRVKSSVNINESYKILSVEPWHYETNDQTMEAIVVEIDTASALDDIYVNVTNRSVDWIWHQPKRHPILPPSR
ncbi:MAG: hypothetical protein LUP97_06165, partial [Methanoregula sp.]|nr:hypothetical protein [Methanoregula sp.]